MSVKIFFFFEQNHNVWYVGCSRPGTYFNTFLFSLFFWFLVFVFIDFYHIFVCLHILHHVVVVVVRDGGGGYCCNLIESLFLLLLSLFCWCIIHTSMYLSRICISFL